MTWRHRVIKTLLDWNVKGNMMKFISNFLSDRRFRVKIGSTLSDIAMQENGIPQGSVLSVILFLVAINDVCESIRYPVQYLCYADDVVIFCRDRDKEYIAENIQNSINYLQAWADTSGFKFSTTKTKCMYFKNRIPLQLDLPRLTLNNEPIEYVLRCYFRPKTQFYPTF